LYSLLNYPWRLPLGLRWWEGDQNYFLAACSGFDSAGKAVDGIAPCCCMSARLDAISNRMMPLPICAPERKRVADDLGCE
jgi:hypothetical protein